MYLKNKTQNNSVSDEELLAGRLANANQQSFVSREDKLQETDVAKANGNDNSLNNNNIENDLSTKSKPDEATVVNVNMTDAEDDKSKLGSISNDIPNKPVYKTSLVDNAPSASEVKLREPMQAKNEKTHESTSHSMRGMDKIQNNIKDNIIKSEETFKSKAADEVLLKEKEKLLDIDVYSNTKSPRDDPLIRNVDMYADQPPEQWVADRDLPVDDESMIPTKLILDAKVLAGKMGNRIYISYWDLAGEKLYYDTHHIHLSGDAVYLLVFDMFKMDKKAKEEDREECLSECFISISWQHLNT